MKYTIFTHFTYNVHRYVHIYAIYTNKKTLIASYSRCGSRFSACAAMWKPSAQGTRSNKCTLADVVQVSMERPPCPMCSSPRFPSRDILQFAASGIPEPFVPNRDKPRVFGPALKEWGTAVKGHSPQESFHGENILSRLYTIVSWPVLSQEWKNELKCSYWQQLSWPVLSSSLEWRRKFKKHLHRVLNNKF